MVTATEMVDGHLDELYAALAGRVHRIVRGGVRGPDPDIDDACQLAWTRLVDHRAHVRRDTAFGWLVKTARHEALRLVARSCRDLSLDALIDGGDPGELIDLRAPSPEVLFEHRERVADFRHLPVRQQRLLWLQGLGLNYDEMGRHERATTRTIDRQLYRAKRSLRELAAE
jgi:RNA polymerase sigma factor (sigma-70 family)